MDTREQKPLPFKVGGAISEVRNCKLEAGDYAVEFADGSHPPLAFERKSLEDLWGTMTAGYPRFKRELQKAKDKKLDLILAVEGNLSQVLAGSPHSQFLGTSMVQKLFTLMVRHKLLVVFCESRLEMARYIVEYFEAIGREHMLLK